MSRIGKAPIAIPSQAKVEVTNDTISVSGPRGKLHLQLEPGMAVKVENDKIFVSRPSDAKAYRALHGLVRSLLANMVQGVTQGFEKRLELTGLGFRAQVQGGTLSLNLGYSHPISYPIPSDVKIQAETPTSLIISGIDKQRVGQVAAQIRDFRKPEPYKGKGIKYAGERIRRKAGKTGAA
ncbi:MAG: 50S ribosomal protein L6 [candidate division NC10 bacterium]|nr:50S ribosomal protein L6 [candidate division NC10 bacterium]